MMNLILEYHRKGQEALNEGVDIEDLIELPVREKIGRAKYIEEKDLARFDEIEAELQSAIQTLIG